MGFIRKVFETLSGTEKMKHGPSLYDPKEGKKWRDRQEKHYQDFGKRQKRYEGQAGKFLGMYEEGRGKARSMYDRSAGEYQKSGADISRARGYQRSADAMMGDRQFYADLARDKERIKKGYSDARLEQESLRGDMRTAGRSGATQMLMRDAFKEMMDSEEESLNQQTAALAKTNPVAAAKLKLDFQSKMQKGYGKALQEGYGKDVQMDMNKIMAESGLVMKGAGMLEGEAAQNAQAFNERQAQISNYGNAATGALNTAQSQQNIAAGYGNIAGGLSTMAGRDLGAGLQYEGMGYNALKDQASTANMSVGQQQQLQMSDANARAQVDQFNNMRASKGLSNAISLASTATGIYGAVQGANLAGAQADYLRSGLQVAGAVDSRQNNSSGHPRNARFNTQGSQPITQTALSPSDMFHARGTPPQTLPNQNMIRSPHDTTYQGAGQMSLNNTLSGNVGRIQTLNDQNTMANMSGPSYYGYDRGNASAYGGTTMPGNYNTPAFQRMYQNSWKSGGSKDPNRYMWDGDYGYGFKGIKKNQ